MYEEKDKPFNLGMNIVCVFIFVLCEILVYCFNSNFFKFNEQPILRAEEKDKTFQLSQENCGCSWFRVPGRGMV